MKLKTLTLITLAAFWTLEAGAQKTSGNKPGEKIQAEKVAFITQKLDLTVEEAQAFWPVYNAYEKKLGKIQRRKNNTLDNLNTEKAANAKIKQVCKDYVDTYSSISELRDTYHEKFMQILPPEKVFRLYQSEIAFKRHLLQKIQQK